ncbi:MAG TPA: HAD hydrolase-like protein, partial [Acetobacteraceae bacterium]|nr:HAD hydrolase-like protein [Acetobacteraceae bacterium]
MAHNIMGLKALIFDVDGTLAETEELHRVCFNAAFEAAGLTWQWDQKLYRRLLDVTGGKERIRHFIDAYGGLPNLDDAAIRALHEHKTGI